MVSREENALLLEESIGRYQNRAIETAQVIEELIALAREMRKAEQRGEQLGLTPNQAIPLWWAIVTLDKNSKSLSVFQRS